MRLSTWQTPAASNPSRVRRSTGRTRSGHNGHNGRSDGKTLLYRASKYDCDACPLKPRCCPTTPSRKVPRDVNEAARDYTRSLMGTEAYLRSGRERKRIETLFGDLKRNLGLTRLRLRGLTGARDEFLLAATVQNLKRLVKLAAIPPPIPITA